MSLFDTIKQQAKIVSNFMTLFDRAKASNQTEKIVKNVKPLKNTINSRFKEIQQIVPQTPMSISQGANVLKRYSQVMDMKFNEHIDESRILSQYKEVYIYLTKALVFLNTGVGAGLATAGVFSGLGIIIVPLTVICTISVFTNAKKHNISPEQAFANFKRSFKEFAEREKVTKKEKAFAYIPFLLFIVTQLCGQWGAKTLWDVIQKVTPNVEVSAPGAMEAGKKMVQDLGREAGFSMSVPSIDKGVNFLKGITVKEVTIVFSTATIIYLFLSILDQMVLRKGEASTEI